MELPRDLVVELVERHWPDLAPADVELLGQGWDNAAWRVNTDWVFRFARRELAVALLQTECAFLPGLAPRLPVRVPVPERFVEPGGDPAYRFPFAGYRMLPGQTACRVSLTDANRRALAEPLGRFLGALHGSPMPAATADPPPGDTLGRAQLARRCDRVAAKILELAEARALPDGVDAATLCATLRRTAASEPWDGDAVWCHGDFYARHLLLDDRVQLCGVIDWGDLHVGDPAGDLSIAFSFLPDAAAREALFAVWHATSGLPDLPVLRERARFRALQYGAILIDYGRDIADDPIRRAGEFALQHAASD